MKFFNLDGWTNILTGMGKGKSRQGNTTFQSGDFLPYTTLEELYRTSAFARKIVSLPAFEMTREWITIENDAENLCEKALKKLKAKTHLHDCIKWGNLYGGALVIIGIDDGGMLDQPVNEAGIREVSWLRVYDRHQAWWTESDINKNPESENYGEPEFYTINAYRTATPFRVHASRVLRYEGGDVPERVAVRNQGWGDSILQPVYEEMKNCGIISDSVVSIMQDFVQTIINIDNLQEMLSTDEGEKMVKKRLDILDLSRSVNNTVLLDGEEKFSKQSSTVTGIDAIMTQFWQLLSGATWIPATKLLGTAPAGLNATGESDIRNFYDVIKSKQERDLLPMLEKLIYYIMLSREGGFKGVIDEDLEVQFTPLWQMTDMQKAEWKHKVAQTDDIYVKAGVLGPNEVAANRFENGFSTETEIDLNDRPIAPDPDEPETT